MNRLAFIAFTALALIFLASPAMAQNPFLSAPNPAPPAAPALAAPGGLLAKIAGWQMTIRDKMATMIRQAKEENRYGPLALVLALAVVYGLVHAAGPGHGKAVAMSLVLSEQTGLGGGLFFGTFIALFHGLSGAIFVLALRFVLDRSVSGSMDTVYQTTQAVSFGLIAALGAALFLKNSLALVRRKSASGKARLAPTAPPRKRFLIWAASMGLVPCPGVVMVMLFCLSMGMLFLGLLCTVAISLGMATTVSACIFAVAWGKAGAMKSAPVARMEHGEAILGCISGALITVFASLSFLALC